jgi:hypothetical protein
MGSLGWDTPRMNEGSAQSYRCETNAEPGEVSLQVTVPFPLCLGDTSLWDCPLPAATQENSQSQSYDP